MFGKRREEKRALLVPSFLAWNHHHSTVALGDVTMTQGGNHWMGRKKKKEEGESLAFYIGFSKKGVGTPTGTLRIGQLNS